MTNKRQTASGYHKMLSHLRMAVLTTILACGWAMPLQAQDDATAAADTVSKAKKGLFRNLIDIINEPYSFIDSTYLIQRKPRLSLQATFNQAQTGVKFKERITDTNDRLHTVLTSMAELPEPVTSNVGLWASYGGLTVGWEFQVGGEGSGNNSSFALNYLSSNWGINASYSFINEKPKAGYTFYGDVYDPQIKEIVEEIIEETGNDPYARNETFAGLTPARLRLFTVDAFYAFNRRTFSFAPAYDASMLQRRSAGSFLVGAKYLNGKVSFDLEDEYVWFIGGVTQWKMQQLTIGAGYTYNLVLMHKEGASELKHKNLIINAMFLPMISVWNPITMTVDDGWVSESYGMLGDIKRNSTPRFCYDAKLGLALTLNRFVLNIAASHNASRFKAKDKTFPPDEEYPSDTKSRMWGDFFNWSVDVGLQVFL